MQISPALPTFFRPHGCLGQPALVSVLNFCTSTPVECTLATVLRYGRDRGRASGWLEKERAMLYREQTHKKIIPLILCPITPGVMCILYGRHGNGTHWLIC